MDCVDRIVSLLRNGLADGTISDSVDPATTGRIIVGSFFGIQEMSARLTDAKDLIERTKE